MTANKEARTNRVTNVPMLHGTSSDAPIAKAEKIVTRNPRRPTFPNGIPAPRLLGSRSPPTTRRYAVTTVPSANPRSPHAEIKPEQVVQNRMEN